MSVAKLPSTLRKIVEQALDEDGAREDITADYLKLSGKRIKAEFVAGEDGVAAGVRIAGAAFALLDASVVFEPVIDDGAPIKRGDTLATVEGGAQAILSAERVALNFVQRLSGIATLTSRFVERVKGTGVTVLDTRKTTPLIRVTEKYAVHVGGGQNHRYNLTDMLLIKENHLRAVGGLEAVSALLREGRPVEAIEIEVDSPEMLGNVLELAVDRIMLDNFTPDQVRDAMKIVEAYRAQPDHEVEIEVSGGISLENIADYALPGVDYISVGALTHSATWLDVSLEVR